MGLGAKVVSQQLLDGLMVVASLSQNNVVDAGHAPSVVQCGFVAWPSYRPCVPCALQSSRWGRSRIWMIVIFTPLLDA